MCDSSGAWSCHLSNVSGYMWKFALIVSRTVAKITATDGQATNRIGPSVWFASHVQTPDYVKLWLSQAEKEFDKMHQKRETKGNALMIQVNLLSVSEVPKK